MAAKKTTLFPHQTTM
nr:unnamed protein product [Callosobruchus chinensis]